LSGCAIHLAFDHHFFELGSDAINGALCGLCTGVKDHYRVACYGGNLRNACTHSACTDHCYKGIFGQELGHRFIPR
jgi:hypothetical protein